MTEDQIAAYLLQTPAFFDRHASLLLNVRLRSGYGQQVISLQERQSEMLREKIQQLEKLLADMANNSQGNASIAEKIHRWSCALARIAQPQALPHAITEGIQRDFDVPQVAIRIWGLPPALASSQAGTALAQGVSADAKAFASSLTMPFCGPNLDLEPNAWLPRPQEVQSLALLPLRDGPCNSPTPAFGMLVLGSHDPLRFDATMGTELLSHIAEQASAALARLRHMA